MRRLKSLSRLVPASGGFNAGNTVKTIRFVRMGCANRPFYHIVVAQKKREQHDHCIEQIGSFDPMPNERNEKVVAINFERLAYWMGQNVATSTPFSFIVGLSGYFPIHPTSYVTAWRNRRRIVQEVEAAKAAAEKLTVGAAEAAAPPS